MIIKAAAFITCGGSAPTPPPPPAPAPSAQDAGVTASRDGERRRRRAAASNTVLTSYQGAATTAGQAKTLLGQ